MTNPKYELIKSHLEKTPEIGYKAVSGNVYYIDPRDGSLWVGNFPSSGNRTPITIETSDVLLDEVIWALNQINTEGFIIQDFLLKPPTFVTVVGDGPAGTPRKSLGGINFLKNVLVVTTCRENGGADFAFFPDLTAWDGDPDVLEMLCAVLLGKEFSKNDLWADKGGDICGSDRGYIFDGQKFPFDLPCQVFHVINYTF